MNEYENLINDNIKLAYKIAWEFNKSLNGLIETEDLKSLCLEGLVKAAKTFDTHKDIKFSTYAYPVIKNNVLMHLRNENKSIKNNVKIISLDSTLTEDGSTTLADIIPDSNNVEDIFESKETYGKLKKYINELPKDVQIIILLYGQGFTQVKISELLNKSQPYISRKLKQGINMLRYKYIQDNLEL